MIQVTKFYLFIFTFSLLFFSYSQGLVTDKQNACNGVDVDTTLFTPPQMNNLRTKSSNSLYSRYQSFLDYYNGSRTASTYLKIFSWEAGLFITLMVLIFISIFVFLFSICCCIDKCKTSKTGPYFYLSIGLFIAFTVLFILIMIYIGLTVKSEHAAECQLYNVPYTIIYGSPNVAHNQEFIGYRPFISFLNNFKSDSASLSTVQGNMINVINSNIDGLTNTANSNLISAYTNQSGVKVNNGSGVSQIPVSSDLLEKNINTVTGSMFESLNLTAFKIVASATEARFLSNSNYINYTQLGLDQLYQYLTSSVDTIETFFTDYINGAMNDKKYIFAGFWVFFGLCVFLFVASIICLIILVCVSRDQCKNCFILLRTIISLFAIATFLFSIAVLILLIGTVSASAMCRFLALINQGDTNAINHFSQNMDQKAASLIQNCLVLNSNGQLMNLTSNIPYTTDTYNRLLNLINGQKAFNDWKASNPSSTTHPGIDQENSTLTNVLNGIYFDFNNVLTILKSLNSLVSCSNVQYHFSTSACSTCTLITSNSVIVSNSCISDLATAQKHYSNLQDYIKSENTRIGQIQSTLNISKTSYKTAFDGILGVSSDFTKLQDIFKNTNASIKGYNNELSFINKCTNIKVEMQIFENNFCFNFTYWLYILAVVACVATFALFLLMWTMCCAVRSHDKKYMTKSYIEDINLQSLANRETIPEL